MNSQCHTGYWETQCDIECHCLNGAACDRVTGKCDADLNSGLSLCEPGYISSIGVNLENCQRHTSCFADCTKTCHCYNDVSCNPLSGQCPVNTLCQTAWGGASCQTGIIEVSYEKTNPNQALQVTCIVTGDQVIPTADQVALEYINAHSRFQPIGEQVQATRTGNGRFLKITFLITPNATHPVPSSILCNVRFEENGVLAYANAWIYPQYFVPLTLTSTPEIVAGTITPTSVTIQWDAWNPYTYPYTDTGDGPVIGYNIYDQITMSLLYSVTTVFVGAISRNIAGLTPKTNYQLTVRPVGPGGEGFATQSVTFTTLPSPTQSPPLYPPSTASTTTEKRTPADVQTSPPPTDKPTLPSDSDMKITTMPPGMIITETTPQDVNTTGANGISNQATGFTGVTLYITISVIAVLLVLILVIILWFVIRKRNTIKEDVALDAPAQVIYKKTADDDDEIPIMTSCSNRGSMSSLDVIDSIDVEVEQEPSIQGAAAHPIPPPIPTELAGAGPSLVSTNSIKTRLIVPAVNVKDFANYVKGKRQNAELQQEWESLPKNLCRPTTMGKKPENKGKNRFRNVVAYDHSRVVLEPLEDDPDSDYINACYIKGVNNPRAYIASQGPKDITIDDYWRMVWQENISVMVMACNIIETGKLKCVKYWPDKGTHETFGDFDVTFDSEEQKHADYLIRNFTISKNGEEGTRKVVQFHYTNWPDKDIPKHCTPVLQLLKEVNEHYQDRNAPLLIHCSAGAGRTGALIAIHTMMEMAEQRGQVDIYNFVFSMRNSRANIVQTPEQYAYVHDAMLEHLFCKNSFVKAEEFAARLKSLQEQNPETGNTHLEDEYAILDLVSPTFSSYKTQGSLRDESLSKMRSGDSIPVDASRPYLMTSREDGDMSPYINAAFMNGYKKKDLFISTQMPLTHTVVDIWRMMYDYNCTSIVHLNAMDHEEEEDCPQYWPDEGTSEYGPFSVSLMEKESMTDFEMKTLRLVYTKRDVKSPIPVRHFQYTTWPKDDERPATSEGILQLISAVEKWQKTLDSPGPIVVLCMGDERPATSEGILQLISAVEKWQKTLDAPGPIVVLCMGDERPATSEGILQLISAVEKWQKTVDSPGPIVVLCMNAAGFTGAFCTIQTCLDQVREEQGANVLQNVKQLRIHRTNMVDTPTKYLFCYETILEYLKAFDDYASKKSYQNVMDVKKDLKEVKEPKKKKKQDDAVIYGNQETINEIKKSSEAEKQKESANGDMPQGASNIHSKSEASESPSKSESSSAGGNLSPSTAKKPTLPVANKDEATSKPSPSKPKPPSKSESSSAAGNLSLSIAKKPSQPRVNKDEATSKPSPSSRRKSTPLVVSKTKPPVTSKPKHLAKGRPKTYVDGGIKSIAEEGDEGVTKGADVPQTSGKKQEQLYQNVAFDTHF
ncbi:uncharacterized protein [Amphiura filiformis]|uniref:uncharacterized protein n=1 Tax=Amphiura filiformis TaxID=82378 RepID=UPI003B20FADC